MKLTKSRLKEIIKEELQSLIKKEGLDKDDKEKLASLEKQETALAAERSKSDSNALEKKHKALKDKIKAKYFGIRLMKVGKLVSMT